MTKRDKMNEHISAVQLKIIINFQRRPVFPILTDEKGTNAGRKTPLRGVKLSGMLSSPDGLRMRFALNRGESGPLPIERSRDRLAVGCILLT